MEMIENDLPMRFESLSLSRSAPYPKQPAALRVPASEKENADPQRPSRPRPAPPQNASQDTFRSCHAQILSHLANTSRRNTFAGDPFAHSLELNKRMKRILLNWLFEVCGRFSLGARTMFLCENLLVRHLQKRQVRKEELQLTGMACLLVASKFEDVYPPEAHELSGLVGGKIPRAAVLRTEEEILFENQFDLVFVSALDVVEGLFHALKLTCTKLRKLSRAVLELFLFYQNIGEFHPFQLAAFALSFSASLLYRQSLSVLKKYLSVETGARFCEMVKGLVVVLRNEELNAVRVRNAESFLILEKFAAEERGRSKN